MDDLSPSLLTPPTSLSSSLPQLPHTTRDQVQASTDQTAQSRQPQIVTRPKSVIVFNRSRPLPSGTKPRVAEPDIMEVAVALHDDDASGSVDSPAPSSPFSSVSSVEFSSASSSPNSPSSSSSPESNSDFNQPGWVAVAGPSGLSKEDRSGAAFASDGKRAANLRATPPPQAPYEVVDLEDVDDIDYSGYDSDIEFIADLGVPAPGTVRPRPPEFDNDNARDGNAEDDSDDDCQIVFEKPIKRFRRNPEDVNADEPIEAAAAAVAAAAAAAVVTAAAAVAAALPVDVVAPPNENNDDDAMDEEDDEDEVDNREGDQQQGAAGDGQIDDDVRNLAEILDEIVDHELVVRQEQVMRQDPVVAHDQEVVQAPAVVGQPIVEGPVVGQLPPPPARPPVPANAIDPDEALRMDMHVIDEHLTDYMNQQIPIHNVSSDDEDDDDVVVEEEEIQQNLNDDVIFMHRILGPQQARRPTLHLNELRALRDELALGPRPYRPPTPFAVVGAPAAAAPAALPTPPPPPPPQIEIQIREVEVVREVVRVEVRTEVRQERVPGLVCSICFDDTLPDENATPPPPPPPATRNRPRPAGALGPSGAPRAENPWDPKFWSINCGHIYCEECINSILTNNPKNCAVCRKRFTRKQTHRIYMTA